MEMESKSTKSLHSASALHQIPLKVDSKPDPTVVLLTHFLPFSDFKKRVNHNPSNPSFVASGFLRRFYNSILYCFLSPGQYVQCQTGGNCQYVFRKSGRGLQILVFFVQLWSLLATFLDEILLSPWAIYPNWIGADFRCSLRIFSYFWWGVLMLVNLYLTLKNRRQPFCEVLNRVHKISGYLQEFGIQYSEFSTLMVKALSVLLILLIPLWGIYTQFLVNNRILGKSFETLIKHQLCGVPFESCNGSVGVYQQEEGQNLNELSAPLELKILGIAMIFGELISEIATHLSELFALVHAIMYFFMVKGFVDYLKKIESQNEGFSKRHNVLSLFEEICGLSEVMDEAVGSIVAFSCFGLLTYYAKVVHAMFTDGPLFIVQIVLYAVIMGSFLGLAAEANSMIGYLVHWFQNSRKESVARMDSFKKSSDQWDEHERIILALSQLERNQVGIRGRFFTVNYSFVGSMLSLLLTYSILFSQLQEDH